jgi:uncharacterized membrane protein YhhN
MAFLKKYIFQAYGLLTILYLVCGLAGKTEWLIYLKPLLMPLLMLALWINGKASTSRLILLAGLLFSLAGDVLLMNDSVSNYFIFGLACFLLAHICYIWLFLSIAPQAFSSLLKRPSYFIIVLVYALTLLVVLWPRLGELRLPVAVYAGVISIMLLAAIAVAHQLKGITGNWILSGAILFVISDSLLALNKFLQSFPYAGVLIMLTYCVAQAFFVWGYLDFQGHYFMRPASRR